MAEGKSLGYTVAKLPMLLAAPAARAAGGLAQRGRNRRRLKRARVLVPPIVSRIARQDPAATGWQLVKVMPTVTPVIVVSVGDRSRPAAFLKIPESSEALAQLAQTDLLIALVRQSVGDPAWQRLMPEPIMKSDEQFDGAFFAHKAIHGMEARAVASRRYNADALLRNAALTINVLHQHTREEVVIVEEHVDAWFAPLVDLIAVHGSALEAEQLSALQARIRTKMVGREIGLSTIHGDYHLGNVLVDFDGSVTGLIDWDHSTTGWPSGIDMATLTFWHQRDTTGAELGDLISAAMRDDRPRLFDESLALSEPQAIGDEQFYRAVIELWWVRMISKQLIGAPEFGDKRLWWRRNVAQVLGAQR